MKRRKTSIATPVAHLVGPGKLRVINGRLAFAVPGEDAVRLDPAALRSLYCYGDVGITDEAFRVLFAQDVEVAWLTPAGTRCRGRLVSADAPRTALRVLQHQAFQDRAVRLALARRVVAAKVESQERAARHYQRQGCAGAGPVLHRLRELKGQGAVAATLDVLRGVEGAASAAWFELLKELLLPPWQFTTRQRRPPPDPVNALLSLGYTWLLTRTVARCDAAGLETALGALHEYHPGRPSLACDLIEPLRVPAVDRWVVAVCNRQEVKPEDCQSEDGGMRLRPGKLGGMLASWQSQWLENGHDAALDRAVQEVVTRVRARAEQVPTPPATASEGGDPGNWLTG